MSIIKHMSLITLLLSLLGNMHVYCMEELNEIPINFVDLNNPKSSFIALTDEVLSLTHSDDIEHQCAGLVMLDYIVRNNKQGYKEAEEACFRIGYSDNDKITRIVLNLLEVLADHKKAINMALSVATDVMLHKDFEMRSTAINLLHQLIALDEVDRIPQKAFSAIALKYYDTNINDKTEYTKGSEEHSMRIALSNLMKIISKKCLLPIEDIDTTEI